MGCGGLQDGRSGDGEWRNVMLAAGREAGEQPVDAGLEGVNDAGLLDVQYLTMKQRLAYGWDVDEEWSYVEKQQGVE